MQTIIPHPIRRRVEQMRYLLRRGEGGEQVREQGGVVAAARFEQEFAGGGALESGDKSIRLLALAYLVTASQSAKVFGKFGKREKHGSVMSGV